MGGDANMNKNKNPSSGTSLAVQWLGLHSSTAWGMDSTPAGGGGGGGCCQRRAELGLVIGACRILGAEACQASLSITNSQSSPKLMSIESVIPSNHLILCRPLLLLPSFFPSKGGVICTSEVIDISPSNLYSSFCFIQHSVSPDTLCI